MDGVKVMGLFIERLCLLLKGRVFVWGRSEPVF